MFAHKLDLGAEVFIRKGDLFFTYMLDEIVGEVKDAYEVNVEPYVVRSNNIVKRLWSIRPLVEKSIDDVRNSF